jgi:arylsulfatase B|eukprot:COSAG01_NODE_21762_length_886_cov_1.099111_1_plen_90_part_00
MDALATSPHGVHLERFYSQPICTPTRTQMLSGRYQIHTGMQHAVLWKQQVNGLPKNESTIAEYLRPLGYATHAIGKVGVCRLHCSYIIL